MTTPSPDHFSRVASAYAASRPSYPDALYAWLADNCRAHDLAWDCATGNGQAAVGLAPLFRRVVATDLSAEQLKLATAAPGVTYRVAPAEASGLDDTSVDLVTVAQALHWFDLERFYSEVRRVSKPAGVIAAWTYGVLHVEGSDVDALAQRFYAETVGDYWPAERSHVEAGYATLPFPFERLETPPFAMELDWSMAQLMGYFRSWSATGRYIAANDRDPVAELEAEMAPLWGEPAKRRRTIWPLTVLAGRIY